LAARRRSGHPHCKKPCHPQGQKVEREKDNQAGVWPPFSFNKESDQISDYVANYHEAKVPKNQDHKTLP